MALCETISKTWFTILYLIYIAVTFLLINNSLTSYFFPFLLLKINSFFRITHILNLVNCFFIVSYNFLFFHQISGKLVVRARSLVRFRLIFAVCDDVVSFALHQEVHDTWWLVLLVMKRLARGIGLLVCFLH